jgi:hypothetical protein
MTKNLDVLTRAKQKCADLLAQTPDSFPLQSILEQLSYVESALGDRNADRSKLKDVNVGLYAVREFEARSPPFAELLYEVEDIVEQMKKGAV